MPKENAKIAQSLRFSFFDGVFASGMIGFTQDYFIPFLLLIGATVKHVGILGALPNLAAALIQLKTPDLTDWIGSRKKIINLFVLLQAFTLVPMAYIALRGGASPMFFIILVTLFTALGAVAMPPWGSLMSDLVDSKKRGEYFGWRNKTLGFILVGASFFAGFILHQMNGVNIYLGFASVFLMAFLFRLGSWYFLTKMYEPQLTLAKENYFNFFMFFRRIKESNFAKFVLFVATLNFCVNLASPFFAVLMLRELHFDYLTYTTITVTATLTIYLLISRWGRHADKFGNLKIMKFTAPIVGTLPLYWIICQHPVFLILAQIISGFAWAGFNLCASNFIYDAASPQKRTRCIAYFNVVNGTALCLGGLLGGFLLERLPPFLGHKIFTLFIISSFLRILVSIFFPPKLKEVRNVENITNEGLFRSMIGLNPKLYLAEKTV